MEEKRNPMTPGSVLVENAQTQEQEQTQEKTLRRINLNLSPKAHEELLALCKRDGRTISQIVRFGLGLAKLHSDEKRNNNKLAITSNSGKVLREIVFPE